MATHSSILAWDIPWTEGPGGIQSVGSQKVKHHLAIKQQHKYAYNMKGQHSFQSVNLQNHSEQAQDFQATDTLNLSDKIELLSFMFF